MTATEYLYYGFGQIVYSLAFSDGDVQPAEKSKLQQIIDSELKEHLSLQVTAIIFSLLEKDTYMSVSESVDEGLKNMKLGDNHLSIDLLNMFSTILHQVAIAFPPDTEEEKLIISKFTETFSNIK